MVADVFMQVQTRTESGQLRTQWVREKNDQGGNLTIDLIARPILGGGIRVVGSMERFDEEYLPIDWIKFQTNIELSKRHRLYDIRDKRTGRHMWEDNERGKYERDANGNLIPIFDPMWFDIVGVMPIVDPFGRLLEYDSLAKKVQNLEESTIVWT